MVLGVLYNTKLLPDRSGFELRYPPLVDALIKFFTAPHVVCHEHGSKPPFVPWDWPLSS